MRIPIRTSIIVFTLLQAVTVGADAKLDYSKHIAPIFKRYCNGCHNVKEAEGKLVLGSFAGLMKGGENGKVIQPGNAAKSRLIGMVERKTKPFMPPEGNKGPTAREIAMLKAWINAGAKKPSGDSPAVRNLVTPKIKPVGKVRRPVAAAVYSPDGKWIAVARHGLVEILNARSLQTVSRLSGHAGNVTGIVFSRDGKRLFAAAGEPGLYGEATIWNTANGSRIVKITGHSDSLYAIAVSPDGRVLATGSYDRTINLWDAATGRKLRTLKGHNGPVNDLSFHPSGKILASASGDRTVKLWSVATGARLDTLGQPVKGQTAVAFSPDGRFVVAGGIDNRVRVWAITSMGKEGTNPLIRSRFAHEASILKLIFSPDGKRLISSGEDRTVKIWETRKFTQITVLKNQPDWVTALAVSPQLRTLLVGRMDGSLARYPFETTNRLRTGDARPVSLAPTPQSPRGKPAAKTPTQREAEPNDSVKQGQRLSLPGTVAGILKPSRGRSQDVDHYRFQSAKGRTWILETRAARDKSPADTKIEILHADGRPVLRYLLRAVRDSYITFRPIDSRQTQVRVKNWEEMQLNQYLYMNGEIGKLFRAPRGPDSGFEFYSHAGKRRCYFGSSAIVHAKDDPVYIVEPYPPGTKLVENGLPVFRLYYANDDDDERKLGSDSRLTFTAPATGEYFVRITDVRGFGGDTFKYSLSIREARPDFRATISGKNSTVAAGSGQRLTVKLDRIDGFNGEVRIHVSGLPRGFTVTSPIIVQPGHLQARGVLHVADFVTPTVKAKPKKKSKRGKSASPARQPVVARKPVDWSGVRITATAWIHGRKVTKTLGNLGRIKIAARPSVIVKLEVDPDASANSTTGRAGELTIVPGTTTTAMLSIERNGFKGELKFNVDHLPHGVIVDNIGLSGILIRAGETRRRVDLTAAKWVPAALHEIHAVSLGRGNQASAPIRLRVVRTR